MRRPATVLIAAVVLAFAIGAAGPLIGGPLGSGQAEAFGPASAPKNGADAQAAAKKKKKKKRSNAAIARQLAKRVTKAKSPRARYKALRAVMSSLNLSVYKGNGKAVVRGADRRPHDPYVYDFELRIIAGSLARREPFTLEDVARDVSILVGIEVSADAMRSALRGAVRRAVKRGRAPESRGLLLVRELGRLAKPRYDLARLSPAQEPKLNALQHVLILADAVRGLAPRGSRNSASPAPSTVPSVAASGACSQGTKGKRVWRIGKSIVDRLPEGIKKSADVAGQGLKAAHAVIVYKGIKIDSSALAGTSTHYGPADGDHDTPGARSELGPGSKLVFEVQVLMKDRISEESIECYALAGLKIPRLGGVDGIEIDWDPLFNPGPARNGYGALKKHGTIKQQDVTDSQGVARLEFQPRNEVLVGVGRVERDEGYLVPQVLLLNSLGNDGVGAEIENVIATPEVQPWEVEFHSQRASLVFDSKLTVPVEATGFGCHGDSECSSSGQTTLRTGAIVDLEYDEELKRVVGGTKPLIYKQADGSWRRTDTSCGDSLTTVLTARGAANTRSGLMEAVSMTMNDSGTEAEVGIRIPSDAIPSESYFVTTTGESNCGPGTRTQSLPIWFPMFHTVHQAELQSDETGTWWRMRGLKRDSEVFRKRYSRSVPVAGSAIQEDTSVELFPR